MIDVTIVGKQLIRGNESQSDAHRPGCADIERTVRRSNGFTWSFQFSSLDDETMTREFTNHVFGPTSYEDGEIADIKVMPCVRNS